jgi:hypothetical protein
LVHGDTQDDAAPSVQVTVTGPLHGEREVDGVARATWRIDPLPMVISELLNAAGAEFGSGEELQEAIEDVQDRQPVSVDLIVDGEAMPFLVWREDTAWAAVGRLEPDHMLYLIGRNLEPAAVELSGEVDLGRYVMAQ